MVATRLTDRRAALVVRHAHHEAFGVAADSMTFAGGLMLPSWFDRLIMRAFGVAEGGIKAAGEASI
ncbi:hypothetical protein A33O_06742 [Nitratireductor aquibiodomus RA22]|uniref:Uncharacterized protein n=1 Tax=Nitratireductor aquibiodomus RA22 TaxID=1189611 RepID=I5C2S7_9HYPH|nr:hypothetical protein A33O_06742 [Nitratireductor aquibiodomus RA22]